LQPLRLFFRNCQEMRPETKVMCVEIKRFAVQNHATNLARLDAQLGILKIKRVFRKAALRSPPSQRPQDSAFALLLPSHAPGSDRSQGKDLRREYPRPGSGQKGNTLRVLPCMCRGFKSVHAPASKKFPPKLIGARFYLAAARGQPRARGQNPRVGS
jgi:hypothetical protein